MNGPGFEEIKAALLDRLLELVRELLPDGKRNGRYWIARNPTRADKHAGSFWVLLDGTAAGAWRDEAGVRGVDEGDVVKLIAYLMRHQDLAETRRWCLRWLGWQAGPVPELSAVETMRRAKLREEERQKRFEADARAEAERKAAGGESALGVWLKAAELTPATFPKSLLERYFMRRGIDLRKHLIDQGRPLPGALRFFASHDYYTEDGEVLSFPCMAALMTGPAGKPQALHRTWLDPHGAGKAELPDPDVNGPRKIWGPPKGAVIRIWKGAGNLTPEKAAAAGKRGPLVITEGIEDALTCAIAMPDYRVWAAGTLGNIENVPIGLACVSSVTVCRDNDWDKPQAVKSFERAIAALRKAGKPVRVAASPKGKDMNDLLKGETI